MRFFHFRLVCIPYWQLGNGTPVKNFVFTFRENVKITKLKCAKYTRLTLYNIYIGRMFIAAVILGQMSTHSWVIRRARSAIMGPASIFW